MEIHALNLTYSNVVAPSACRSSSWRASFEALSEARQSALSRAIISRRKRRSIQKGALLMSANAGAVQGDLQHPVMVEPVRGSEIPVQLIYVEMFDGVYAPIGLRTPSGPGPF